MSRSGASSRPIAWFAGLFLLIVGPQFVANLFLSLRAAQKLAPFHTSLENLAADRDKETPRAAAKALFGTDTDGLPVTDARQMFGDTFANAELAQFAVLPNGDTVLLARFKGSHAAEKGWIAYLRVTGLNQQNGQGDSQRGYAVTRPAGDRAYVLQFQNLVGVWTGKDDMAIRQRMDAGGFEIPRRAPLAGVSPLTAKTTGSTPVGLTAAFVALNLLIVVLFFLKGAAWAGSSPAAPGAAAVSATELASRLEAVNSLDVPFRIEHGEQPNEFFATWRYAEVKWVELARVHGLRRTCRIRLNLDEATHTVRATDYDASYDWSAGADSTRIQWQTGSGIILFHNEQARGFGLLLDENGRFKLEHSYRYTFNIAEMKTPLIGAVTRAGWIWRPTVWQGPRWLRWLTE